MPFRFSKVCYQTIVKTIDEEFNRTAEEGSRQLNHAAIGEVDQENSLRGQHICELVVSNVSELALSETISGLKRQIAYSSRILEIALKLEGIVVEALNAFLLQIIMTCFIISSFVS